MFRILGIIIFSIFSNAMALLAADYFVKGFSFNGNFIELLFAAAILTAINIFILPIFRLLLGPLIVLTFGLFVIILNAASVYFLDIFIVSLTIQGYIPLLLATLILGLVNIIIDFAARMAKRR